MFRSPINAKRPTINIGKLNVRGLNKYFKNCQLANDMRRYKLQILALQDTKINEDGNIGIETTDGKYKYDLMYVGSKHHGVGIVADKDIKAEYKVISDRICTATFKIEQRTAIFVSTYAPTLEQTQKNPQNTEKFYEDLEGIINTTSCRHLLTIAGDLNAKAGAGHTDYPDNIGRYGKGEINQNGQYLAEMLHRTDMYLTNTTFKHKMSHRTTWEAPQEVKHTETNTERSEEVHTETKSTT